jgi:hypothetical protein
MLMEMATMKKMKKKEHQLMKRKDKKVKKR